MTENNQLSGASAKTVFCLNCLMQFETEEEATEHWAKTCKYGGYNAPLNYIIRPIKEFSKRKARLEKFDARRKP